MQQQLVLSLLVKAPDDDALINVWQAQSIEQRAEVLTMLGRLIAKAVAAPIAGSEEPSDE